MLLGGRRKLEKDQQKISYHIRKIQDGKNWRIFPEKAVSNQLLLVKITEKQMYCMFLVEHISIQTPPIQMNF